MPKISVRRLMKPSLIISGVLAIAVVGVMFTPGFWDRPDPCEGGLRKIDSDGYDQKNHVWKLLKSKPRFKRSECIVRVDYDYSGSYLYPDGLVTSYFREFIVKQEPTIGGFLYALKNKDKTIFMQLLDQCDRRTAFVQQMADWTSNQCPGLFKFNVSNEAFSPGPETIDEADERFWLVD